MQWIKETTGGAAAILGGFLLLSSIVGAQTFYAVRSLDNTLTATGSAKERVTADTVKWTIRTERIVYEGSVAGAFTQVAADTAKVKKFLTSNGIKDDEVTVSPISVEDYYGPSYDNTRRLAVRQAITVQSKEVDRIETASQGTVVLAQQGVQFIPNAPEYLVSNLPELRVRLLGEAVKDAEARVTEIAGATGQKVGKLKSSSSGVVQVLAPDSIDVADYGAYDTSTKEKDVMVTVRGTFLLK